MKCPQGARGSTAAGTNPTGGAYRSESQWGRNSPRQEAGSHTQPELRAPDEARKRGHLQNNPGREAKTRGTFTPRTQVLITDSVGLKGAWRG